MKKIENIIYEEVAEQSIPFEILSLKELYKRFEKHHVDLFSNHRIEFNALMIITDGLQTHCIDFKEYKLKKGVLIPLVKNQIHYFNKQLSSQGFIISFNESFITQNITDKDLFNFLQIFHSSHLQVKNENLTLLQPFIELLIDAQKNPNNNLKADFIRSIFLSLLIQVKRLTFTKKESFETKRYRDYIHFKELISKYYNTSHNAKEYAEKLGVSYKYLNDICKEIGNSTAKSFIDNWLILEIKRNLSEKKYTTQEIAYKMGFQEPSNFIRFFKKHTNTTPSKYSVRY